MQTQVLLITARYYPLVAYELRQTSGSFRRNLPPREEYPQGSCKITVIRGDKNTGKTTILRQLIRSEWNLEIPYEDEANLSFTWINGEFTRFNGWIRQKGCRGVQPDQKIPDKFKYLPDYYITVPLIRRSDETLCVIDELTWDLLHRHGFSNFINVIKWSKCRVYVVIPSSFSVPSWLISHTTRYFFTKTRYYRPVYQFFSRYEETRELAERWRAGDWRAGLLFKPLDYEAYSIAIDRNGNYTRRLISSCQQGGVSGQLVEGLHQLLTRAD